MRATRVLKAPFITPTGTAVELVLESIFKVRDVRRHPIHIMFLSIVLSSVTIWVSFFTFPDSASLLSIAFITIAMMPLIHKIFMQEEKEAAGEKGSCTGFLDRHFDLIAIYAYFFIGIILSYSLWYLVLPAGQLVECTENPKTSFVCSLPTKDKIFFEQEKATQGIRELKQSLTGMSIQPSTGTCGQNTSCWFEVIFWNNAFILFLAVLFSFIYGAGALFLIGWNASVIAIVIGQDAMRLLGNYTALGAFAIIPAYLNGLYNAIGLLPHGVFEITGYFVGAIAGGIIGVALTKGKYQSHEFERIAKDALFLLGVALLLLLIGGIIEAYLIASMV